MPKYEVIADRLRDEVRELPPHTALETERALAERFAVSRITIRSAISRLCEEGALYQVQGSGTYTGSTDLFAMSPRLASFSEDMWGRGMTPSSVVLAAEIITDDPDASAALGLRPGDECYRLRRLRLADDTPMAIEESFLPAHLIDLSTYDPTTSLFAHLESLGLRPIRAEQEIGAVNLNAEQASLLNVPPGAAAMRVDRASTTGRGVLIEYARDVFRADRYAFRMALTRDA